MYAVRVIWIAVKHYLYCVRYDNMPETRRRWCDDGNVTTTVERVQINKSANLRSTGTAACRVWIGVSEREERQRDTEFIKNVKIWISKTKPYKQVSNGVANAENLNFSFNFLSTFVELFGERRLLVNGFLLWLINACYISSNQKCDCLIHCTSFV